MNVECNNTSSNSSSTTNTGSLSNQNISISSAAGSNAAASQVGATNSNNSSSNQNAKNKKLFPKKLWDLINNKKYYYCLRWSEDGQLVYLNRDEFEESYLKTSENQFHTQKAISFVRQMNMYGFRKVDDCYYENDNFKRGCEHLLKDMTRKHPNKSHHHHIASQHLSQQQQQQQQHHHLNQQQQQMINDQSSLLAQRRLLLSSAAADGRTQNSLLLDHHLGANHAPASVAGEPATTNTVPLAVLDQGADLPRTFYALLSSLYSQQLPPDQGSPLDTFAGKSFPPAASLPQQIFQNLMAQQDLASSIIYSGQPFHHDLAAAAAAAATTTTKDLFAHTPSLQAPKWTLDQVQPQVQQQHTTGQASSLLMGSRTTSATSLLAPSIMSSMSNKYSGGGSSSSSSTSNIASDLSLKHLRNCKPLDSDASSVISSLRCLSPGDNNSCSSSASVRLQHQQQQQPLSSRLATLVGDAPLPLPLKRRQDQRLVRSFKRSVDSILDSNEITTQSSGGNSSRNRAASALRPATIGDESVVSVNKRIKLECCRQATENNVAGETDKQRQPPPASMLGGGVNELAKNLVSEIALSRDAHLDANVLHEASKYTESFVQTLFDTALVIARHSNGLNLSDYMLAADANYQPMSAAAAAAAGTNVAVNEDAADCDEDEDGFGYQHEPEYERSSNISVSDLTSALKLLPSKLLKILQ